MPSLRRVIALATCLFALSGLSLAEGPLKEIRRLSKPGAAHERLDGLTGQWRIRVQFRVRPDTNPERTVGQASFRWILGGRFLEQTVDAKVGLFEARGLLGYDNALERYVGSWVDSVNSGMAQTIGSVDESGTVFSFEATASDPLAAKEVSSRAELRIVSPDEVLYTVSLDHPETGEPVEMLRISYRRKK